MKRLLLVLLVALIPLVIPADDDPVSSEMRDGARQLLTGLQTYQRTPATRDYHDDNRLDWHYIPRERAGLAMKAMSPAQRVLAHRLLATGLSPRGMQKALDIMFLEQILFEKERRAVRDPDLYYFTVFGEPSSTSDWGFRMEGHHLSLNFSLRDGKLASASPLFMGANPAIVPDGDFEGMRALPEEEVRGRELFESFSAAERATILIETEAPSDIVTGSSRKAEIGTPVGLAHGAMSDAQQQLLMDLVESYARRLRAEIADAELARVREAGVDAIHFAWAGGAASGEGHYYRIHGPTFLIEYDNTQNGANHIHTVWRDLTGDFGSTADPLTAHYATSPHHREDAAAVSHEHH